MTRWELHYEYRERENKIKENSKNIIILIDNFKKNNVIICTMTEYAHTAIQKCGISQIFYVF